MAATQTFSNSSLVSYTKLSPNHSGKRTHNIDTIAIHCVAGNCTIETIGNLFAQSSREASSNYAVGTDGRIGMYVEEKNRSWCTSSADVDQRAITIEVANNTGAPSWGVSDAAMNSLINLLVDIIQRNPDIDELRWKGNKSLMGNVAQQNMVVHRWTSSKSCPGDYLYNKHPYIVEQVNARLKGTVSTQSTTTSTTSTSVSSSNTVSSSPEKMLWNFLKGKGLSDYATAGLIGNLYAESGLSSNNLQNSYETKLGYTDDTYTAAVDNGSYTNFIKDSAGYGLAQWTYWSRKQNLYNFAKEKGKSIGDFEMQEEFLWNEISTSYKGMLTKLASVTSVRDASDIVLCDFEKPANQSESVKKARASYGESIYSRNADGDETTHLPYTVKVNATSLNIRKSPTILAAKNGAIADKGVYTIVEESTGLGAKKWGKLKSGAGWISLDFCIKTS